MSAMTWISPNPRIPEIIRIAASPWRKRTGTSMLSVIPKNLIGCSSPLKLTTALPLPFLWAIISIRRRQLPDIKWLYWAVVGLMARLMAGSIGMCIMRPRVVVGVSAGGWRMFPALPLRPKLCFLPVPALLSLAGAGS